VGRLRKTTNGLNQMETKNKKFGSIFLSVWGILMSRLLFLKKAGNNNDNNDE